MRNWQTPDPNAFRFVSPEQVHVWLLPLSVPDSFLTLLSTYLSPDEQERAARFRFEKHRKNYIGVRGRLRLLLGRYLGQSPRALRFRYNKFGKPYLEQTAPAPNLQFNISHSNEWALLAFHPQWELGVDIEWMKPDFDGLHLVKRFFSAREIAEIEALPEHLKREAFFNGWTRKEAYIKARGQGLNIPLAQFSVSLTPGKAARLLETAHDPAAVNEWSLCDLPAPNEYKAALVVNTKSFYPQRWFGDNLQSLLEI